MKPTKRQSFGEDEQDYGFVFDKLTNEANNINIKKRKFPSEKCEKAKMSTEQNYDRIVEKKLKWLNISEHQKIKLEKELIQHILSLSYPFKSQTSHFETPPNEYESAEEYVTYFKPILYDEIRAALNKAISENEEPYVIEGIISKIEITGNDVLLSVLAKGEEWGEFDFLVLSSVSFANGTFPKQFPYITAVSVKKGEEDSEASLTVRCLKTNEQSNLDFFKVMERGKTVYLRKITSIISSTREYVALTTIQNLPLLGTILKPTKKQDNVCDGIFGRYLKRMEESNIFNSSQLHCISSALSKKGFSLIQGPPGTGKTKTLLGILGAIIFGKPASISKKGITEMKHSKVLVCAPSNAAVDEIVLRLQKEGILNGSGEKQKVNVIRVGNYAGINPFVNEVLIDTLILSEIKKRGISEEKRTQNVSAKIAAIEQKMRDLTKEIEDTNVALNSEKSKNVLNKRENEKKLDRINKYTKTVEGLNKKRDAHRVTLKQLRSEKNKIQREFSNLRKEISQQLFDQADVICCTLNTAASEIFLQCIKEKIENVIIDEAAQSVEISTLIPLRYGAERCVLIGDPQQLPATVLSSAAQNSNYNRSLFERLYSCGISSDMLKIQYRMHPLIREFPSAQFYFGELMDGRKNEILKCSVDKGFGPVVFYDAKGGLEEKIGQTLANEVEVQVVIGLLEALVRKYPESLSWDIGVVTPYRQQLLLIKMAIESSPLLKNATNLCANTIDGFQGREMDIIVFSCVRSSQIKRSIGFLSDVRRMNVALTRAKNALWVIGNTDTLMINTTWKAYIDWLKEKDLIITIDENVIRDSRKFGQFGQIESVDDVNFVEEKKDEKVFTVEEICQKQEQERADKRDGALKLKKAEMASMEKEQQAQKEIKKRVDKIEEKERNKMNKRLQLLREYEEKRLEEELEVRKLQEGQNGIGESKKKEQFEEEERKEIEERLKKEKERLELIIREVIEKEEKTIRSEMEKKITKIEDPKPIGKQIKENTKMEEECQEIKMEEEPLKKDSKKVKKTKKGVIEETKKSADTDINIEEIKKDFEERTIQMYKDLYLIEQDIEDRETNKIKVSAKGITKKINVLTKGVAKLRNDFTKCKCPPSTQNKKEEEPRKRCKPNSTEYKDKRELE